MTILIRNVLALQGETLERLDILLAEQQISAMPPSPAADQAPLP